MLLGDCSLINVPLGDVYLPSYWFSDFCWMGRLELPRLCLLLCHVSNENWLWRLSSRQRYKSLKPYMLNKFWCLWQNSYFFCQIAIMALFSLSIDFKFFFCQMISCWVLWATSFPHRNSKILLFPSSMDESGGLGCRIGNGFFFWYLTLWKNAVKLVRVGSGSTHFKHI